MDIINRFNNLSYNKQKHKFHDSSLLQMHINFDLTEIKIIIEYCRYISADKGDLLNIEFIFKDISNIQLVNEMKNFGIDDDIYSFIIEKNNSDNKFIITGNNGWIVSFTAFDFTYSEVIKERLTF